MLRRARFRAALRGCFALAVASSLLPAACSEEGAPPGETEAPRLESSVGAGADRDEIVARGFATPEAREPSHTDWSGGDAASGQALFATHCAVCHGGGGTGDGPASAALNPKPRDFTDGTFYVDADADNETGEDVDLARVILEGPAAFGGSPAMQGWRAAFSDDEVRDLIAYIRRLSASG